MIRHDWTHPEVREILDRPFHDLLAEAHSVHNDRFDRNEIEGALLVSIKTGGCSEDCAYCPQSAHHQTGLDPQGLLSTDEIVAAAREAKAVGATRFCMGAAWRSPSDQQVEAVAAAVHEVAALELQTCATLGMLTAAQAAALATGLTSLRSVESASQCFGRRARDGDAQHQPRLRVKHESSH